MEWSDGRPLMALPIFQTQDQPMMLMQTAWSSELNPVIRQYNADLSAKSITQEFAWNSNITTNLAAGGMDSTSFGNTSNGARFGNFDSVTTNSFTSRVVRFLNPIKNSDLISLEYSQDGGTTWTNQSYISYQRQGLFIYGFYIYITVDPSSLTVAFGNGGATPSNAAYSGAGQAWSNFSGDVNSFWRVRKISFS